MSEVFIYPLAFGETLGGADWIELRFHRVLGSRWRARVNPTAGFYATMLWWESARQNPAGTLPDDDTELAQLAGLGQDVAAWRAMRAPATGEGALYGWAPCLVRDGEGGHVTRLYHRTITEIVVATRERQTAGRARSASGAERNRLSKVRRKLVEAGLKAPSESPHVVAWIDRHLAEHGSWVTVRNVATAFHLWNTGDEGQVHELKR